MTSRNFFRIDPHFEFAATPGEQAFIAEAQTALAESEFQPGGVFVVADEQVGQAQSEWVERAA